MAQRIILYWRDIPAQILVQEGRKRERRELPERFIQAIDRAAMRVGAKDSDTYLAQWRKGAPEPCAGDLAAVADAAYAAIIGEYDSAALDLLVQNGGHSPT